MVLDIGKKERKEKKKEKRELLQFHFSMPWFLREGWRCLFTSLNLHPPLQVLSCSFQVWYVKYTCICIQPCYVIRVWTRQHHVFDADFAIADHMGALLLVEKEGDMGWREG